MPTQKSSRPIRRPWHTSVWLFILGITALNIAVGSALPVGWRTFSVPSASNLPTIVPGDRIFADITASGRAPHRGDMIVFRFPHDPRVLYVKRVIGLPGDHVQIKNGLLYLNAIESLRRSHGLYTVTDDDRGPVSLERYTETLPDLHHYEIVKYTGQFANGSAGTIDPNNTPLYVVPKDALFVLGDNRDNSADSRFMNEVGYIPLENIVGRAVVIYWSHGPSWRSLVLRAD